jgi:hypothetical protein
MSDFLPSKGPTGRVQGDLINFLGLLSSVGLALGVKY